MASVLVSPHDGGWLFQDGGTNRDERSKPKASMSGLRDKIWETWEKTWVGMEDWAEWAQQRTVDLQTATGFSNYEGTTGWEFSIWMLLDTAVGLIGWVLFGSAWGNVKLGMKRMVQIGAVMLLCIIAHYVWAVCYPVVSIIMAVLMAVVWTCKKILKMIGTVVFYSQRWAGGAPEAADAEFHGPGTGVVPETSVLRTFKRSGDNSKLVIVKRGGEVAVFNVGTDSVTIRTHGLYLPVEPDTVRGDTALAKLVGRQDKVHLCRNSVCTEEGGEHFTEYAVAKKFVAEKFQTAQAKQGAISATKRAWDWMMPAGNRAVRKVVGRVKEFASESETEDCKCVASAISWKSSEGVQTLAETRCTDVGVQFKQLLTEDVPVGLGSTCPEDVYTYVASMPPCTFPNGFLRNVLITNV